MALGSINVDGVKELLNFLGQAFPFQDEASKNAFHEKVAGLDSDTPVEETPAETPAEPPAAETPAETPAVETPAEEAAEEAAEAPAAPPTTTATAEAPLTDEHGASSVGVVP